MPKTNLEKNSSGVIIRKYTEDQQKQVYSLILSIFEIELQNVPPSGYLNDIYAINDIYAGDRNHFWTACLENKVVGTIAIKEDSEEEAIMRRFFVSPVYRGKGIARQLFQTAVNFAKKAGYKRINFIGNSQMYKAYKFLTQYGFEEIEQIDIGEIEIFKLVYYL